MTEQTDINAGVVEAARSGQGAELAGNAAEQLEALVFGGVFGGGPAESGGAVQAAGQVVAGIAGEGVQERYRAEIGVAQPEVQGHAPRIGHTNPVFRKKR